MRCARAPKRENIIQSVSHRHEIASFINCIILRKDVEADVFASCSLRGFVTTACNNLLLDCTTMKLPMPTPIVWPSGLLLNEDQIQDLRKKRNKRWFMPQSLSALAIQSVTTNIIRFIDVPDSPLKYLPNTIVQQLLSQIASDIKKKKTIISHPLKKRLLGLLVNPFVTEIDFNDIECIGQSRSFEAGQQLSSYLFKHALENCPKIRKTKLTDALRKNLTFRQSYQSYDSDDECSSGYDDDPDEELPVESFKKSWKNLTTIICQSSKFYCDVDTMMVLQENFPNLEELAVSIAIWKPVQTLLLDHLINMKRLHTLKFLNMQSCHFLESEFFEFLSDVAGTVPSLRNFGLAEFYNIDRLDNDGKFIDLFGEKYPFKKLLVDKLRIEKVGLKRKWPKNLSVKLLKIDCDLSDTDIENLSTLECTLSVKCRVNAHTYQVLDCIGGLVESLTIYGYWNMDICLERILAACPNLEHFNFQNSLSVVQDPRYNLSPAAFKNYKSFKTSCRYHYLKQVVLQQVFQKFLIGTEVCETLELQYDEQLETIVQVALAYPESLQQLRELHIAPTEYFFPYDRNMDRINLEDVLLKYDKCFYQLITCCHKLERIFFHIYDAERVIERKQENRYHFTIQTIDPHFINYSERCERNY